MKKLYSTEEIQEMRKRLYERNATAEKLVRHELSDQKIDVSRNWLTQPSDPARVTELPPTIPADTVETAADLTLEPIIEKPKRRYRSIILIGSMLLFILVAISSTAFVYFGDSGIASDNIQVSLTGQSQVGGGESLTVQIAVTNNNRVPLESAALILQYPSGTRSVGDSPRNLFEERIPLGTIDVGQAVTQPVQIAVFGEENAEKVIGATLEYRVSGSNGMFYKEAEPLAFKISSSPLVLRIDSIEKVAGGQLVDITISAVSNASTPLDDILITAAYPNGFTFESSDPAPVYGQNVWRINSIRPEETSSIKLQGIISGFTDEQFRINFKAGPANPDNQYAVGSTLAEGRADFIIERPFIDVVVRTNGSTNRSVVLAQNQESRVEVAINNTLEETVYDMVVEVVPGGNALIPESIKSSGGFYDSNKGVVRWEVSNNESFTQVLPGGSRTIDFTITPGPQKNTASYEVVINVYARRVAERSAQETLIGTTRVEGKYSATVALQSQVGKNTARFIDGGPVPPEVGKESFYTITLVAEAGANDLANAVMETALPVYVNWLDTYDAPGSVVYNTVSKNLQWNIGDMKAGERKEMTMQISFTPSLSQDKSTPTLLNRQQIRANDRFTGALLQDSAAAVTTELSTEMGFPSGNGAVIR